MLKEALLSYLFIGERERKREREISEARSIPTFEAARGVEESADSRKEISDGDAEIKFNKCLADKQWIRGF